jgi:two-component system, LytTR family, sensor kinase
MPMTEPAKRPILLKWTLVAIGWWCLFGLVSATQYHAMRAMDGVPVSWAHALVPTMTGALLWVPFSVMILWMAERRPLGTPWLRSLPLYVAATLLVIVGRAGAVVALNPWVDWYDRVPAFPDLLVISAQNNIFIFWLVIGAAHAVHYAANVRQRDLQLADARLRMLKGQLQPHFLFNSLNTAVALLHENSRAAERVIVRLSELLRVSLHSAESHEVPLYEELDVVAAYLEIEQARFEGDLTVEWCVDDKVRNATVPHLILQPLVENAIRHGIAPSESPGTVALVASLEEKGPRLRLAVRDNGVGWKRPGQGAPAYLPSTPPNGSTSAGIGLANVSERLARLYPNRHTLTAMQGPDGGTEVVITLPYRPFGRTTPTRSRAMSGVA